MPKERLDTLLVLRGLAPSRQKAQALILSGNVLVDDKPIDKVGTKVSSEAELRLRGAPAPFVGRGGEKLAAALESFALEVTGRIAVDIGASTGGFTDCLLQRGASTVYAVDVGYNQLAHRIRSDPRVIVMEKLNARYLEPELFPQSPDLAVVDVSFISVRKILPSLVGILCSPADLVVLVKPQFELEPGLVGKGGVVAQDDLQLQAIAAVVEEAEKLGLRQHATVPSALRGQKKGNQEHFVHFVFEESKLGGEG